jgi:dihydrofolate reductase
MRKLIAGMKVSVDAKMEGQDGMADWVDAWSNDYDILPRIDACLLGGGMYPGYESYWSSIQSDPEKPLWLGKPASAAEREWGRFAARTPHYVLSRNLVSAQWPHTTLLRGVDEVAALKHQAGKDIYLVGGARPRASSTQAWWTSFASSCTR